MPPKKDSKSGFHKRFEPITTQEINESPSVLFNFHEVGCLDFCQRVQEVKNHPPLTHLFALRLQEGQIHMAGLDFTLSPKAVAKATKIPYLGEKWFKQSYLNLDHYKPFLKLAYQDEGKAIFPFAHLLNSYAPLMKVIMRYFTCEGRYSKIYAYHIRLLMHFTRTQLLNFPFFLCRSIDKMASTVQKKPSAQQQACLFHHSLIKIIILHQLEKKGVSWESFISHPDFAIASSSHGPSHAPSSPSTHHDSLSSSQSTPKKQKYPMIESEEEKSKHTSDDEEQGKESNHSSDDEEQSDGQQGSDDKEAWLEREIKHLEDKLEDANKDLSLQRKMTGHYKKLNQFARRKLKDAQEKLKTAQRGRPVRKKEKDTSRLGILAQASRHVSKKP